MVDLIPAKLEELDISVGEEISAPELKKVEEPEPAYPSLHDFMFGKKEEVKQEQPIDLSISYAQLPVVTPKMIYFDLVNKQTIEQLRKDLNILYDFGFVDFEVNKALLMKHKNVEQVAGILLEGRLSESVFNQVYGQK